MANHKADDAADELREAIAPVRTSVVRTPEEFGLHFLTPDELIARAEESSAGELAARRSRRPYVAGGLAAAAAVVGAVVLPSVVGGPDEPTDSPSAHATTQPPAPVVYASASDVLLAAAGVKVPPVTGAPYWHVKSLQTFGKVQVPREIWLGNGRPSVLVQDGIVDRLPPAAFPAVGGSVGWAGLQSLPADEHALARLLEADAAPRGRTRSWVVFKAAGDLVAEAPLPPAVRSSLWKVLASTSGARHTEQTTDAIGRRGWTVSLNSAGEGTVTYVVDPASGQLLEVRHQPAGGRQPWAITFFERGPADSAPELGSA